jgi:hypothetical protein
LHLILEFPLLIGLPEHLSDVEVVGLCELAGRLPGSFRVEDPLHRVEHVAAILCRCDIGQCSILVYRGDDLCHLGFHGLFGVLDIFDLFIALLSQTGQIVSKALHAVVGSAIRTFLDAVLFGHEVGMLLTLLKGITEIIGRMTPLRGERTRLGILQHVRKLIVSSFDGSAICLAILECQHVLLIGPLITDKKWRPFSGREVGHLHIPETLEPVFSTA